MTQASPNAPRPPGGGAIFFLCGLLIGSASVSFVLASRSVRPATPDETAILADVPPTIKPLHSSNAHGLRNVFRLGDHLYSGSSPDDEVAFATLVRLGVQTVISVDGAAPDIEMAHQFGLRYVHLPISYSSVPRETLVQLVRASRELPGPIYLHCHHGKHRGPAAAVSLWRCLDKSVTDAQAFAALKSLGTADRYRGLFSSVKETVPPKAAELAAFQTDLPEVTPVPPLAKTMAEIDRMWDRITGPESDATAVSMQLATAFDLAEHFREAARLADVTDDMRPALFQAADELDQVAETIKSEMRDSSAPTAVRTQAIARVKVRCNDCHAKFRD
jgi:protein tyrosine phosphatase (PTP) superfamily phosphohydrolase (DUF442 family)